MSKSKPAKNRSKRPARTQNWLLVAGTLFLSKGYAGVSLKMIVQKTGGSYRDLYRAFGGKEALFRRVINDICSRVLAPLRAATDIQKTHNMSIDEALFYIAYSVLQAVLSPRVLALHRLIISESARFPGLAKTFLQAGPDSANLALASFLELRRECDELLLNDSLITAAIFFDAVVNNLQLQALTGSKISRAVIRNRAHEVTRIFLNGLRARPV